MQPTAQPSTPPQPAPTPRPGVGATPPKPAVPAALPVRQAPADTNADAQPAEPAAAASKKKGSPKALKPASRQVPVATVVLTLITMAVLSAVAIWIYLHSSQPAPLDVTPTRQ